MESIVTDDTYTLEEDEVWCFEPRKLDDELVLG